jgi:hypothetical protein
MMQHKIDNAETIMNKGFQRIQKNEIKKNKNEMIIH